ncbi:hypothetical protein SKAU_G00049090 [Synaphobranchus kaupii]|uniref:Uncharacterized protein n=1 Tax=Synaphobranchus kaupii TaxID=118154 RepID=A0A9Q1G2P3_SYNKA|nr:hypothetical protein SKAU_G00049090 [Synaphobranchus kaupii]
MGTKPLGDCQQQQERYSRPAKTNSIFEEGRERGSWGAPRPGRVGNSRPLSGAEWRFGAWWQAGRTRASEKQPTLKSPEYQQDRASVLWRRRRKRGPRLV